MKGRTGKVRRSKGRSAINGLKNRSRSFAIAGATITLLSFIANDIAKEAIKERMNNVSAAVISFDLMRSHMKTEEDVMFDETKLHDKWTNLYSLPVNFALYKELQSSLAEARRLEGEALSYKNGVSALIDSLPCDARDPSSESGNNIGHDEHDKFHCGANDLEFRQADAEKLFKGIEPEINQSETLLNPVEKESSGFYEPVRKARGSIYDALLLCLMVEREVVHTGNEARTLALKKEDYTDRLVHRFDWIVSCLFGIGWLLGMVGIVWGVGNSKAERPNT
jgi:hypothetical protein